MKKIDEIDQQPFNYDRLKDYCCQDKQVNGTSNELVFELTRDMADPTKDFSRSFYIIKMINKNLKFIFAS